MTWRYSEGSYWCPDCGERRETPRCRPCEDELSRSIEAEMQREIADRALERAYDENRKRPEY
jgi:hypothetical protein